MVADNARQPGNTRAPVNGIFVGSAEFLSICNNVITDNGNHPNPVENPARGVRAGIAVIFAGFGNPSNIPELRDVLDEGGSDLTSSGLSLRIADNTVRHREGRALYAMAAGPIQVDGNFLSSEGFHGDGGFNNDRFAVGDVVFIQNFGAPWETFEIDNLNFSLYDRPRDATRFLRNEVAQSPRHFMGIGGQTLFQNNQVVYDWELSRVPASTGPFATFAVAILGLDHTSVSSNHFAMRFRLSSALSTVARRPATSQMGTDEIFYSHVFATGATVEAVTNRVAEAADTARFSLLALGELAFVVTHNQTMHEVHGSTAPHFPTNVYAVGPFGANRRENQEMLRKHTGEPQGNFGWIYDVGIRLFMTIMERPSIIGPPPGGGAPAP
jgi:hypothetical protein